MRSERFYQGDPPLAFDESAGSTVPSAFGPYRVLHQIGSGVLGPVFRTYDPQHDRLIAIKSFRLDLPPEPVARLADALRRLTTLSVAHRCIVAAVDAGLEGTTAYLASEYVAAETLDVTLRHLAPAPLDRALPIIRQIAEAIDAAAAAGLMHGALHPRDVFVTLDAHEVRIAGFGVAQALESVSIKPPVRRPYTAPERSLGEHWGTAADIYSLGAIAHELLTRRRPAASGEQDGALTNETTAEQRVQIRRVLSIVLADRPEERFPTAQSFANALAAIAQGELQVQSTLPLAPAPVFEPVPAEPVVVHPEPAEQEIHATLPGHMDVEPAYAAEPVLEPAADVSPAARVETQPWHPVAPADDEPELERVIPATSHAAGDYARRRSPSSFPWAAVIAISAVGIGAGAIVEYRYLNPPATVSPSAAAATASPEGVASVPSAPRTADPPMTTVVTDDPAPPVEAPRPAPRAVTPAAPAARPTAPSARARAGRLVIRSVPPGAMIVVDGRRSGQTPMTVADLALGSHTVEVARSGYVPFSDRLTLSGSTPVRSLSVHLRPGLSTENGPHATPASQTSISRGSIFVDSRPQRARVIIDGRFVGLTPLRVPEVRLGIHSVRMEMAGYQPFLTTVGIRSGQQEQVTGALEERQD